MTDDTDPMSTAAFNAQLGALGLSQADLYRMLQLDKTTVSRWSTGRRPVPMSVALLLIAWGAHPKLIPGRDKLPARPPRAAEAIDAAEAPDAETSAGALAYTLQLADDPDAETVSSEHIFEALNRFSLPATAEGRIEAVAEGLWAKYIRHLAAEAATVSSAN